MIRTILLTSVVVLLPIWPVVSARQDCVRPGPPSGFRAFATRDGVWDRPWAFSRTKGQLATLRRFHHSGSKPLGPTPIQLDDGTRGTLRVIARRCGRDEDCSPYDCGCTIADESFWIEVRRANGDLVLRKHLWAAYERFEIVAADLLGGRGDELLIVRIPAHASPPIGWDLKIWNLASPGSEIGTMHASAWFGGAVPYSCAWWMATAIIDTDAPKPRPIHLEVDFAAADCCRLNAATVEDVAGMRRPHALRYDGRMRQYVLTGPAVKVFSRD